MITMVTLMKDHPDERPTGAVHLHLCPIVPYPIMPLSHCAPIPNPNLQCDGMKRGRDGNTMRLGHNGQTPTNSLLRPNEKPSL